MPTLSELQQQSNDAEHQAFQRAYDALLDIAKDPITCRHFWDAGFTAGQADANDMLTVAHMDGYSKGRDAMQRELEADAAATKWRPMETAPRHYTKRIRVRNRRGSEFFVAWAQSNCWLDDDGDERDPIEWLPLIPMPSPDGRELVEALREGRRAIGEHSAPHDCYATGPLTGDEFIDLVQCPACCFIAKHEAVLVKWEGKS